MSGLWRYCVLGRRRGASRASARRLVAGQWRSGARRVRRPTDLFHRFARASSSAVGITRRRRRTFALSHVRRALLCERYSGGRGWQGMAVGARGARVRTFIFPVSNPFVRLCLCHWASVSVRKTFLTLVSFRFTVLSANARTKSLPLLL